MGHEIIALQMMTVLRNRLTLYCSIHLGHCESGVRDANMAFERISYVYLAIVIEPHIYR
jgi:hypothetical protein